MQIAVAFSEIAELAGSLGITDISKLDGCWEHQVDENWWFSLNAHKEPTNNSKGAEVPPYNAAIEYNGLPIGIIGPTGGAVIGGWNDRPGETEDAFIKALQSARAALSDKGTNEQ
ncbi:MAG: hypothetical protein KAI73_05130 [Rhodospirillaceae bacterium]|nr:hypothetical protein [Rhodospirillaceae bacterium]